MRNVLSAGIAKPAFAATTCAGLRDGVRRAASLGVPVGVAQQLLLARVDDVAALLLELGEERVVDRGLDDQVAVGRAA